MSTILVICFPLGRYHATPWGRHVNEGQIEVPPSPWRLLRALYAVWKTRVPEVDEAVVHALLLRLAAPPTYYVPPYQLAHTRHYYPDSVSRRGTPSVDRTLDAFAVFERGAELVIQWAESLPPEEEKALARLAASLPYLGRADSICEARLERSWAGPGDADSTLAPLVVDESVERRPEAMSLLAPAMPLDVEALVARPVDVRARKLLFPPATQFVPYERRRPRSEPRRRTRSLSLPPAVVAVTFSVDTGDRRQRPPMTDAVAVTDRLRGAALYHLKKMRGALRESSLAGRHDNESVMQGHRHAHYLAVPDSIGRLGELVVWAPRGLAPEELEALTRIQRLWPPGPHMPGPGELQVAMASFGNDTDVLPPSLLGPSRAWRSVTPFVPSRHAKKLAQRPDGWNGFVADELQRELAHREFPDAHLIRPDDSACRTEDQVRDSGDHMRRADDEARAYIRYRPSRRFTGASDRWAARPGSHLRIAFAQPVGGPLTLGHLSHFGLGLFAPDGSTDAD